MRVLYDHQIFSSQIYGGISRYFYELLCRFGDDPDVMPELALRYTNNSYLLRSGLGNVRPFFPQRRFFGRTTLLNILNGRQSRRRLKQGAYDVFHPTYYDPYFLRYLGSRPYVVTVYDMVHELYPEMYRSDDPTRQWKHQALESASRIIAISEQTRRDLVRCYGLPVEKIDVIHLACSLEFSESPGTLQAVAPYLLYVGQRGRYKNFPFFIRALAALLRQDRELTVICAGGGALTPEEVTLLENLGIARKVIQMSVHDEALAELYRNARAFVFPSLYEGFGIPILEAFTSGCPVVLSPTSCFPEVAADAALYFVAGDDASLASTVERVVYDEKVRTELQRRGFERARDFSWDKTARETRKVYEGLL